MELDELKQTWKQTPIQKTINTDIMELIQHKSYGPLAAIKRSFRKDMMIMMIMPFILILTNLNDLNTVFSSIMFWSYVVFCAGIIGFVYYNYQLVRKMEGMDGMVKSNLRQQLDILETRLRWNIIGLRIAMIYFILLTEIVPYFQHYRMLDLWHSFPSIARYGTYAGLLILQYYVSRQVCNRKYGQHIEYLKKLVNDMQ